MKSTKVIIALLAMVFVSVACTAKTSLPPKVNNTYLEIKEAANKQDFSSLQKIIDKNPGSIFKYSFGPNDVKATEYWQKNNKKGFFKKLSAILATEPAIQGDYYVWPGLFTKAAKELNQDEINSWVKLEGKNNYDAMVKSDMGYMGLRLAIDKNGYWVYYISGD